MRHTASSMVTHPHLGSTSWLTLQVLTNKQLRVLRAAVASIAGSCQMAARRVARP